MSQPTNSPVAAHESFRAQSADAFDLTKRRHKHFNLFQGHWRFMLESYEGGPEYLFKGTVQTPASGQHISLGGQYGRNLFKYFKEGEGEYTDRLARSTRNNYARKVVNQIRAFMARKPPSRRESEASDVLQAYWKNADGRGRDIDRHMMIELQWAAVFGLVWVLLDKPKEEFENRGDELEGGLPFAKLYFPFDVLDASFDERGNLKWIMVRELHRDDDNPLAGAREREWFIVWTATSRRVFIAMDSKEQPFAELVNERVDHDLGFVPFRALRFSESQNHFVVPGLIDDIAYLDRQIFNHGSQLDTIICDQTFSQLTMPTDAVILNQPARMEGDDTVLVQEHKQNAMRERLIEMGTKRVVLYAAAASAPPKYISPDATQAQVVRNVIRDNTEEIYRLAGLLGEVGREVKTQTGVSKAYDFDRLNKVLAFAAQELEQMERWQAATVEAWMTEAGAKPRETPEELIQYPRDFDIMGVLEELDIGVRYDEYDSWSPTADGEMRKRIAKRMVGQGLTEANMSVILSEIEAHTEKAKVQAARDPLDPAAVPAAPDGSPSQTRGEGGGARGPGSPPVDPTRQQASSAEGGGLQS